MYRNEAILLVANYSNKTGYAWNNIYELFGSIAKAFFGDGYSVCISFATIEQPVEIMGEGIPLEIFEFDPQNLSLAALLELKSSIKKHHIKYVYFTDMNTWYWLYALLRFWGVKRIIVHCRISVQDPMPAKPEMGVKRLAKTLLNRTAYLRADYVYSISNFVSQRLIEKHCYPRERVVLIPNGIDTKKFSGQGKSAEADQVTIFCCSRASVHKGIHTLISAAKILMERGDVRNFIVQYAGDGPDLESFKNEVEKLKLKQHFVFLGRLESTHEYAQNSDIVVVPSQWGEGFASTVVEGMAAGKPVVATTAGGIPEVLGDQSCGRFVPPGDSELLARALAELINDATLRKELGHNARNRALKYFDISVYHQRVIDQLMRQIERCA